jgi:hypothetical protein
MSRDQVVTKEVMALGRNEETGLTVSLEVSPEINGERLALVNIGYDRQHGGDERPEQAVSLIISTTGEARILSEAEAAQRIEGWRQASAAIIKRPRP